MKFWPARKSALVYSADTREQVLALTFDDGPAPWTEPILDTLAKHGVAATFFVVGDAVPGREETLRRIRDDGHEVGNHSRRHPKLDQLDGEEVRAELRAASAAIESVLDTPPRVFRPPYFAFNDEVRRAAWEHGFRQTICASVIANDWEEEDGRVIGEAVLANVTPGCIIDLHDGRPPHDPPHDAGFSRDDREPTVLAVQMIVPELLARGYRFLRVSELLEL